ncbi:helix-turn-helix domain-containing protein [Mucilaginibacter sp. L196]|uniref:helix-turn-helix domain-containing protein n=1 Tax=Mucilaginibacter sp. L196 TaxID=1641870 RepID=UPI00131B9D5D|nr:helix-turn-helix domain-containing protein [Mucilaginibacter sp. L196]
MSVEIITKEDLQQFKLELLKDISNLLTMKSEQPVKWLKGFEVRQMLKISPGTLQNLRINGTLPFSKLGTLIYYKLEDIQNILEGNTK